MYLVILFLEMNIIRDEECFAYMNRNIEKHILDKPDTKDIFELLLVKYPKTMSMVDKKYGKTLLMNAIIKKNKLVEILLSNIISHNIESLEIKDNKDRTVLHYAVASKITGIVESILPRCIDMIHIKDATNHTPLSLAIHFNLKDIIDLLTEPKLVEPKT